MYCPRLYSNICPTGKRVFRLVWLLYFYAIKILSLSVTTTVDSSVGRAVDCSVMSQVSIGRWFKSGSTETTFGQVHNI